MRLFDNSAIKIDLFPGRKEKKKQQTQDAQTSNVPRAVGSQKDLANRSAGYGGANPTMKAAKSMQEMGRGMDEKPYSTRSHSGNATRGTSLDYSSGVTSHTYTRPPVGRSNNKDARGYDAPWSTSDPRHNAAALDTSRQKGNRYKEQKNNTSFPGQNPNTAGNGPGYAKSNVDGGPSTRSQSSHEYARPSFEQNYSSRSQPSREDERSMRDQYYTTGSDGGREYERPTGDQRRSRADLQDEFEAEQKLMTNIPRGAPHSTGHALKHKRSKADMIRATENMARTLSRSPHRSPASRRQPGDDARPGTSSSNGSFKRSQLRRTNSSRTRELGPSHMNESMRDSSRDRPNYATDTSAQSVTPNTSTRSCSPATNRSGSANSTERVAQKDVLSPSKVPNVAKKQGKALQTTARTSPPLPMEPNKTTWSPTSSVARKKKADARETEQKNAVSTTSTATQATQNGPSAEASINQARSAHSSVNTSEAQSNGSKNHADAGVQQDSVTTSADADRLTGSQNPSATADRGGKPEPAKLKASGVKCSNANNNAEGAGNASATLSNVSYMNYSRPQGNSSQSADTSSNGAGSQPSHGTSTTDRNATSTAAPSHVSNSQQNGTHEHTHPSTHGKSNDQATSSGQNPNSHQNDSSTRGENARQNGDSNQPTAGNRNDVTADKERNDEIRNNKQNITAQQHQVNNQTEGIPAGSHAFDFATANSAKLPESRQQPPPNNDEREKDTSTKPPLSKRNPKYVDASNSTTSPWNSVCVGATKKDPRLVPGHEVGKSKPSTNSWNASSGSVKSNASVNNASNSSHSAAMTSNGKSKPTLQPINVSYNSSSSNTSSARAKVVTVNDGGDATIVPTPATETFTKASTPAKVVTINNGAGATKGPKATESNAVTTSNNSAGKNNTSQSERRKDSGQSDGVDYEEKTKHQNEADDKGVLDSAMESVGSAIGGAVKGVNRARD